MTASSPRRLTARQVAAQLEMALNTVYVERAAGRLPAEPHGSRSWRWTQEAVDAYRQSASLTETLPRGLTALIDERLAIAFEALAERLRRES